MILFQMRHKEFLFTLLFSFLFLFMCAQPVLAQEMERRVQALEDYVETFQPTLLEFSTNLQNSIQGYTEGLETSLNRFTKKLQVDLDNRLRDVSRRAVVLNLASKSYHNIETNTGNFLISVERFESIPNGYRLYVNIGNPNFADYEGFKLRLRWGKKYHSGYTISFDQWRKSLAGAEYTFDGKLYKGLWNQVEVDINAPSSSDLAYLECELDVLSIELQSVK